MAAEKVLSTDFNSGGKFGNKGGFIANIAKKTPPFAARLRLNIGDFGEGAAAANFAKSFCSSGSGL